MFQSFNGKEKTKKSNSSSSSSLRADTNNFLLAGMAVVAAATSCTATTSSFVSAEEKTVSSAAVDIPKIKGEIAELIEKDNYAGPTFLRLAWHASGTYCKKDNSGGSSGGTIRLCPESRHPANAGLDIHAVATLEGIKKKNPSISYADLYVLSGITAIEEMGGPSIPFRLGRSDTDDRNQCTPDGRLPAADLGSKEKTIQGIRDVFYRMGFSDRHIVALVGAHAVGRCYPDRSGYDGPWTRAEFTFSNEYFRELIENKWTIKKWKGPEQYEDPSGDLMMLPADMALLWDPEFRKYCEMYAKDEELWHKDFSSAFTLLTENGVKFPSSWRRYLFFGPRE